MSYGDDVEQLTYLLFLKMADERTKVEEVLNIHLPDSYDRVVFKEKCDKVFDLMLNYASQGLKWAA